LVAVEEAEVVQGIADAEDVAELEGAVDVGEALVDVLALLGVAEIQETCFGAAGAAEAPGGCGEFVEDEVFDGAGGLDLAAELLDEAVEFPAALAINDGLLGGEAVLEGVAAGDGASGGGSRAGGLERVAAVGRALAGGGHSSMLLGN
jgi:hypothetical protein